VYRIVDLGSNTKEKRYLLPKEGLPYLKGLAFEVVYTTNLSQSKSRSMHICMF
jgi:hypothetical protein